MNQPVAVQIVFWVFAAMAVWCGYRVFKTDSMVRASFLLLASFLNVGAIMLLLFAEYLGFALFFMMAVEMTVMAIFMVMFMMNPAGLNPMNMTHQTRVATAAGWALFIGMSLVALLGEWPDMPLPSPATAIRDLGRELMGESMMVFESAGVTLLAAMVTAAALSTASGRFGDGTSGSVPPPLDPDAVDDEAEAGGGEGSG